jgi:hypothetical protein
LRRLFAVTYSGLTSDALAVHPLAYDYMQGFLNRA